MTTYTLDRLKDVKELLKSIRKQSYANIEVIFIGENCRELCDEVSRYALIHSGPNVTVLFNQGESAVSVARNLGIEHARGDIIAFLDDDAVASPTWAEEIVKTYAEHEEIIGVAGAAEPLWEGTTAGWLPRELYWLIGCTGWMDLQEKVETTQGATVNVSYKKEAFSAAGLFSSHLGPQRNKRYKTPRWRDGSGEDNEFSRRVRIATGKPILFNPAVRVWHRVNRQRLERKPISQRAWATGWSRHMLKRFYGHEDKSLTALEQHLLRRIATRLLPAIMIRFLTNPVIAWQQLRITVLALVFAAFGYLSFPFCNPFMKEQRPHGANPDERLEE